MMIRHFPVRLMVLDSVVIVGLAAVLLVLAITIYLGYYTYCHIRDSRETPSGGRNESDQ